MLKIHQGLVAEISGSIQIKDNRLIADPFTIDMRKIFSLDFAESPLRDVLIHPLMDYDFFEVEK